MLALHNIKILDLSYLPPGDLCTMILGDLGADVIKIEAPPEEGIRGVVRGLLRINQTKKEAAFDAANRNKSSIGLNLRSETGRQIFYKLAGTADVIVENFKPGTVKRLGVDYQTIKEVNPRIVYCSLSGYGQDGPYSSLPGHDINYISLAGALNLIGTAAGPPTVPPPLIADFAGASLHGAIGILAALLSREKTHEGQYVDISYTDGTIFLLSYFICNYFSSGNMFKRGESAFNGAYPYYGVYETRDGKYISLGCTEPWFWENLCRALDKPEYTRTICCLTT